MARQNHKAKILIVRTALLLDAKVNYERKAPNNCATNLASDFRKHFWIVRDALKVFFYGSTKFPPQTFALTLISANGVVKLKFCNASKDQAAFHLRYLASSFALTSAHETTSSGWSRCS